MICWKVVGMEVQDYKKPNVQLGWKVPVCQFRLLHMVSCTSQSNPLVLVPPWPFRVVPLGAGWVRSSPSGAWSGCVARRDGLSSSNSEACAEEKSERGCTTPLPRASGEVHPSLVLPGVGKLCHGGERAGELCLKDRAR